MSRAPETNLPPTREELAIDATLAALRAVEPRDGLPQRVLARLVSTPPETTADRMRRWLPRPWLASAAALGIVTAVITISTLHHPAASVTPAPLPHPMAQPAGAAAAVGVGQHPLEPNAVRTPHHRGVRRSARAVHGRAPLPHGTVAPARPAIEPAAH